MYRLFLVFWSLLFLAFSLPAQSPDWISGDLIVQFKADADPSALQEAILSTSGGTIRVHRVLSHRLHLYLLQFDPQEIGEKDMLQFARQQSFVQFAQFNHLVSSRHPKSDAASSIAATTPNDPNFGQQWALDNTGQTGGTTDADIDATDAWDITTGGLSALGDTIVVAIIDEGTDSNHDDIGLWTNHLEIPGDGLDNDNNGYVDDINGWNAYDQSGIVPSSVHGTHVAGIAAARGDNMLGGSGVIWDAQVMNIAGSSGDEATVLEAYGYVLEQRARYNDTDGAEGAFVVVTNSSFGVNFGQASNFPAWCAMYDSLGAQGIVNVVATMNIGQDVDQVGDMPATCTSNWVIAVTNTDHLDQRNPGAAFGLTHIDLGAPGTNVLSTFPNGTFGILSGTSMAAPHVAGSIALLFSGACPALMIQYRNDPAQTALLFRDFILDGVDSLAALQTSVATGGRLNVDNSLSVLLDSCANLPVDCLPPYQLTASSNTDTSAVLSWTQWQTAQSFTIRYRQQGQTVWTDSSTSFFTQILLTGLSACQSYEFQVQAYCTSSNSGYFATGIFQTQGCCEAPTGISVQTATDTTILLQWNSIFGSTAYVLEYRPVGTTAWTSVVSPDTSQLLSNLTSCTSYEVRIATQCGAVQLDYSPVQVVTSRGCGACLELDYCDLSGTVEFEWIRAIQIGPIDTYTEANGGYGDFTGTIYQFDIDSTYDIRLTPGFNGPAFDEFWRIWVDVNQDGIFDSTELLFEPPATIGEVSGTLSFPVGSITGSTRMRVSMKFPGFGAPQVTPPCGSYQGGEVEDYCIILTAGDSVFCSVPQQVMSSFDPGSDSLIVSWDSVSGASGYDVRLERVGTTEVEMFSATAPSLKIGGLLACTDYRVQVQAHCSAFGSGFSEALSIKSQGCGACLDLQYCSSSGQNANIEWIAGFTLGGFDFSSGPDQGYGAYTNFSILFPRGDSLPLSLRPGFATSEKDEYWQLWIDWNQNGSFDDPDERVYQSAGASVDTLSDTLVVPVNAPTGTTRLRVMMSRDSSMAPCANPAFGEVEDYCVNIIPPLSRDPLLPALKIQLFPNPSAGAFQLESSSLISDIQIFSAQGQLVYQEKGLYGHHAKISMPISSAGLYMVRVTTVAGVWTGKFLLHP